MAEKNIYEKLAIVQQTLKAPKNQYNSFGKYHYRSCEDILEGLKEPLKSVGAVVTISDGIEMIGDRVYVKATAKFTDGTETVENTAFAREELEKKGMDSSQITGATSSYARKYALNGLFLIDDNKDADSLDNGKSETATQAKTYQQEKKDSVEKAKISEAEYNRLFKQCEDSGINPSVVCDKCNVKDLHDLTKKQFVWLCSNWSKEIVGGVQG